MQSLTPLAPGQPAPDFSLSTDMGHTFALSAHRGAPVVLFFYPQADTEGCTVETLEFDGLLPNFEAAGAVLAGISPDTTEKLRHFRQKFALKLALLADPGHLAIDAYGLWREKVTFGRSYTGLVRTTVLVMPDGTLGHVWTVTRIKGHAAAVLAAVRELR